MLSFEAFNLSGGQYKKIFGNIFGPFCDFVYSKNIEKEFKAALAKSNSTTAYGTCPIPPQTFEVIDYAPEGAGDVIPPYMPGNERWKVDLWGTKNGEVVSGFRVYAILRDEQKLFDSKW